MAAKKASRGTAGGRAYLDLQNQARRDGRATDELLQLYALEGFLDRLAGSPHASSLVLKGGVLLAAYEVRRPTRDVDLQAQHQSNDVDDVLAMVKAIAAAGRDDGLEFDADRATAEVIREDGEYSGVRVELRCSLGPARLSLHVDVNVGDPVWPPAKKVTLPRLLGGIIEIAGYPLSMVFAEKIVTAVQRAQNNTRWRDFADILLLSSRHAVAGAELQRAITSVAAFRKTELAPLAQVLELFGEAGQARWAAWRTKQRLDDRLPGEFSAVVAALAEFADPVLTGRTEGRVWSPSKRSWA